MTEELREKVNKSLERLKSFCPKEGYYLAFSGGKDSVVCKALLDMSGCAYDAHYRVTGIDPPELVKFIKEYHPDVEFEFPVYPDGKRATMWNLIEKNKYPPTRLIRYCCRLLKEDGGDGRMLVTGVRWAESTNRAVNQGEVTIISSDPEILEDENFSETPRGGVILTNDNESSRRMIEQCYKRNKTSINPIIEWSDKDVWDFIHENNIPYCKLYDEGFARIGCIGCPMAGRKERQRQFELYPSYKQAYINAFDKMLKIRKESNLKISDDWKDGQSVFDWWVETNPKPRKKRVRNED